MKDGRLRLLSLLLLLIFTDAWAQSPSERYDLVRSAHRSIHYLPQMAHSIEKRTKPAPDYYIQPAQQPKILITMPGDGQAGGTKGGGKKDPTVSSNITTTSSISTAPSSKPTQHETGNSPATITTALSSNTTANFTQAVDANLDVVLYCTIDPTFCRKVGNALGAAAYKLVQVIGLKSKVV